MNSRDKIKCMKRNNSKNSALLTKFVATAIFKNIVGVASLIIRINSINFRLRTTFTRMINFLTSLTMICITFHASILLHYPCTIFTLASLIFYCICCVCVYGQLLFYSLLFEFKILFFLLFSKHFE